jgi:hypothetical protein
VILHFTELKFLPVISSPRTPAAQPPAAGLVPRSTWTTAGSVTVTAVGAGTIDAMILEQICLEYTMSGTNSWMRVYTYDAMWGN